MDRTIYQVSGNRIMTLAKAFAAASFWQSCITRDLNITQNSLRATQRVSLVSA